MINRFAATPRCGANLVRLDRTHFTFWAPDVDCVMLEAEGMPPIPMQKIGGYFDVEVPCEAGTRYRFRVRSDLAVPDPASRAQAADVHGASLVVDPYAYEWRHPEWLGRPWHEAIIYELHVGALGGFASVSKLLPDLLALGITAVELMPVADFPGQRNWGYDGVLPYAPDASYGTPDQLKHLIDTAHGLGMMVLLDVVYNHFGPDGNYLHTYAPSFFRDDVTTPWGKAIDFRNPDVCNFFIDNALLWLLEYRFDGLRFDAVHAFRDRDFLMQMCHTIRDAMEIDRHVHLVLENDDNDAEALRHGFNAQWSDDGHHALHILLTGERAGYYADYPDPAAALARALKEGFTYQGETSGYRDGERRGSSSADLPPTAFVMFLQNHDQVGNRAFGERLTTLANPAALAAATLLLLLSPQIPLLFMGEEWGETKPFLFFTDHHDELADMVREGRRQEFARFADFANPAARERIPDPNDPRTFLSSIPTNAVQRTESQQITRAFYARLIALRVEHIIPYLPGAHAIHAQTLGAHAVMAVWRLGNGTNLTIAANMGDMTVPCPTDAGHRLAAVPDMEFPVGQLPGYSAVAWLNEPRDNS